jgi:hypothetical protein
LAQKNNILPFRYIAAFLLLCILLPMQGYSQWSIPIPVDTLRQFQWGYAMAIAKDGTIAIACGENVNLWLYISRDHGKHFTRYTDKFAPASGGYDYTVTNFTAIAFDSTNTLWVLWEWYFLDFPGPEGWHLVLSKTSDYGNSVQTVFDIRHGYQGLRNQLFIDNTNTLCILRDTIVFVNNQYRSRLIYTRLNPSLGLWENYSIPLVGAPSHPYAATFCLEGDSIIHVVQQVDSVRQDGQYADFLKYTHSTDGGRTFTQYYNVDTVLPQAQFDPRIIPFGNSVLLAYSVETSDSGGDAVGLRSYDHGMHFGDPLVFYTNRFSTTPIVRTGTNFLAVAENGIIYREYLPDYTMVESTFVASLWLADLQIGADDAKYLLGTDGRTLFLMTKDMKTDGVGGGGAKADPTFSLSAAPNPFRSDTRLYLNLANPGSVTFCLYNVLGQEINNQRIETFSAGEVAIPYHVDQLASGTYFLLLTQGNHSKAIKLIITK